MNHTVKIDNERQGLGTVPVVKFIIRNLQERSPSETPMYGEYEDEDLRDKACRDFLHTPSMVNPNNLFTTSVISPCTGHAQVTTIRPIPLLQDKMWFMRNLMLNECPMTEQKRINDFFDSFEKFFKD